MLSGVMILCAGLGTRLRPLTDWCAKPMVPVGDRSVLEHIVAQLRRVSFNSEHAPGSRFVVNIHHRPDDVRVWADANDVLVSEQREDLLGTAGGVEHAAALLGEGDVLVWNGDILAPALDVQALANAHASAVVVNAIEATLAVVPRSRAGEGNVGIDDEGRIVRLRKESFTALGTETRGADFIGVHVLGANLRAMLPKKGCLVSDVYIPALARGAHIHAFELAPHQHFADIGSVAAYVDANRCWLRANAKAGETSFVDRDAIVATGANIDGSIIGADARVDQDAIRSIVWPHTHVHDAVADAIVTPFGTLHLADAKLASS